MQSIILKGDDNRVQPFAVKDLAGGNATKNAPAGSETTCETQVEVMRSGDQVYGLEVRCSCGEVTVIELNYPNA